MAAERTTGIRTVSCSGPGRHPSPVRWQHGTRRLRMPHLGPPTSAAAPRWSPIGQEHRQHRALFRCRRGRPRAGTFPRGAERGRAGGPAGGAGATEGAAAHRPRRGRPAASRRRQGAALCPGPRRLPGRTDPPRLRLHGRPRLSRHQSVSCRAHGHRCHRWLRSRPARALFRRRSAVRAALQADALGRERGGVHALSALGPGAEGRPRHAHRRSVAQARPRRHDDPHRAARLCG